MTPKPMSADTMVERLRELIANATPGPYRAHDHTTHPFDNPDEWVGYAWVGRVTKDSHPDGAFDAGWADLDRRKDGCKVYREKAAADAAFIAETLNALPDLLDRIERLEVEKRLCVEALRSLIPTNVSLDNPHWPDDTVLPCDVTLGDLRKARTTLSAVGEIRDHS